MKRLLRIAAFFLIFTGIGQIFHFLLVDDTQSYTRLMLREFYEQPEIDVLFVGSSHCYTALDPAVTDELFQMNTFNAGSSLQAQDASFALIREAVERFHVQQVYLEMYYLMMSNDEYADRTQMTGTYIVSDYMRPSLNKALFLLQASSPKYYVNGFIPARRNWERLLHPSEIAGLLRTKMTAAYRNYEPFAGYVGKGFVANREQISAEYLVDTAGFDRIHTDSPSADWLRTIREIMAYCEKHHVRLTLFSAPMTLFQTAGVGNYDAYIDFIRGLAAEYDVEYVDFNLTRPEYWDPTNDHFSDAGHLNESGAVAFSRLFGGYFTGKYADKAVFYSSMAEKLADSGAGFLGLSYLDSGDGSRQYKVVTALSGDQTVRVEILPEGSESRTIDGCFFSVPQEEHGTIRITAGGKLTEVRY